MEEEQNTAVQHFRYTSRVSIGILQRSREVSEKELTAIKEAYPDPLCYKDIFWIPWDDLVKIWEQKRPAMILIEGQRAYNLPRPMEIPYVDATDGTLRKVVSTDPDFRRFTHPPATPVAPPSVSRAASL